MNIKELNDLLSWMASVGFSERELNSERMREIARRARAASAAPAEGREIVAWRHKWTNSEESGWGYYSAGPQADKLRLGLPGILGRDSGRENWEPLCLATAPTMIEEDAAIELLRKFMEYRDSDYVPNVLFDQARLIIDRAAAKGESDE